MAEALVVLGATAAAMQLADQLFKVVERIHGCTRALRTVPRQIREFKDQGMSFAVMLGDFHRTSRKYLGRLDPTCREAKEKNHCITALLSQSRRVYDGMKNLLKRLEKLSGSIDASALERFVEKLKSLFERADTKHLKLDLNSVISLMTLFISNMQWDRMEKKLAKLAQSHGSKSLEVQRLRIELDTLKVQIQTQIPIEKDHRRQLLNFEQKSKDLDPSMVTDRNLIDSASKQVVESLKKQVRRQSRTQEKTSSISFVQPSEDFGDAAEHMNTLRKLKKTERDPKVHRRLDKDPSYSAPRDTSDIRRRATTTGRAVMNEILDVPTNLQPDPLSASQVEGAEPKSAGSFRAFQPSSTYDRIGHLERDLPQLDSAASSAKKQAVKEEDFAQRKSQPSVASSHSLKHRQLISDGKRHSQILDSPSKIPGKFNAESMLSGETQWGRKVEMQNQQMNEQQRGVGPQRVTNIEDSGSLRQQYQNRIWHTSHSSVESKPTNSSSSTPLKSGVSSSSSSSSIRKQRHEKEEPGWRKRYPVNPERDDFAAMKERLAKFGYR